MKNHIYITISEKEGKNKQLWREMLGDIIKGGVLILIGWAVSKFLK